MTSDGQNCYTYNDANQLSKVTNCSTGQTIAQYVYDYQGNRIEKKVYSNGTLEQTVYSPSKDYQTVKLANGTTQNTSYYHVNDELVAQKNPDGSKYYVLSDNLGSTSVLTNQTGNVVESSSYYPFGQIRSGATQSKYAYTGQVNDDETGLDYYNSRYYDSSIMHFTQPDSEQQNVYDPQQLNRYSYVRNNPMTVNDPTGHGLDLITAITFFVGGTILLASELGGAIRGALDYFFPPAQQTSANTNHSNNSPPAPIHMKVATPLSNGNSHSNTTNNQYAGSLVQSTIVGAQRGGESPLGQVGMTMIGGSLLLMQLQTRGYISTSTGRNMPTSPEEQDAMNQVMSNPEAGFQIPLKGGMQDPRWPGSDGWVKMQQIVNGINIHYVYNPRTGESDDFKFK